MQNILSIVVALAFHCTLLAQETKGVVHIQSEIEGLNISINEKPFGITSKNSVQRFVIEDEIGTGGFGFHKLVVQKEINATHEFYGEREFKYEPFEPIIITAKKLQPRLKKRLLATQNGLLHTIPLKHRYASYLEIDERYIYVLSQSRTKVYSKKKREAIDAEYLEIYDKKTLSFVTQILLNEDDHNAYDRALLLHQGVLYIASKNGNVLFWDKEKLITQAPKQLSSFSPKEGLNKLRGFGVYLFVFGKDGLVEIYQNNLHVKTIDTKQHRFKGYDSLEDKRFDRIFDVLYANETLFIANDLGKIQVYALGKNPTHVTYVTTLLRDEKEAYDVLSLAWDEKRLLVVGKEARGLEMVDTQSLQSLFRVNHFVKSDLKTTLYRTHIVGQTLLFTEGLDTPHLYAYDLKQRKLFHDFQGTSEQINDFKVSDTRLYSLDDGNVHVWHFEQR